ncbi:ribosomal protein S18-alanine N-acetyltransferase [Roseiarcaceae bacterium H3SJ34-1]|uniref:ribosomal protein S18-alanine N-acetyltransferase n=1 Tax=Terripilifer ovatus TaxID=3032367 RepID=UPI003AB936E0|nr:ribosomal protein S18-alanine N-acetyltransferase [Roseiarcaceae bacterium H3SJ34-1]
MFRFLRRRLKSSLRDLRSDDAAECARLHALAFAFPWNPEEFEQLILSSSVIADGAFDGDDGQLTGFVLSRMAADESEILTIIVDPALRRRGIAAGLLDRHIDRQARHRIRSLFLEVAEDNEPAITLYRRRGFEQVGRRKAYYRMTLGAPVDALVMRKQLI